MFMVLVTSGKTSLNALLSGQIAKKKEYLM